MELKSIVAIEVEKNERIFKLELPVGAPLGDAYEACWEMLNKIVAMAKESVDQAKPKGSGDE